jgi:hypothetical protein
MNNRKDNMALPANARKVSYTIGLSGSDVPQVDVALTADIVGDTQVAREASDAAVQLGVEAIIADLDASYPSATVVARRYYETYGVDTSWSV